MTPSYSIQPAPDGGHYVCGPSDLWQPPNERRQILFAGGLDECLAYVRKVLAPEQEPIEVPI